MTTSWPVGWFMRYFSRAINSSTRRTGAGLAALCAILALINLPALALSPPTCNGIHVKIPNIRNSAGTIACALFVSKTGFPREYLRFASNVMATKIAGTQVRCDFEDVEPGTYALAVIHDENRNGKLDANALGIPTEGYGFSNDPKTFLGAPSFYDASFSYNGQNLELTIGLHY